jgi:hypothetical protein
MANNELKKLNNDLEKANSNTEKANQKFWTLKNSSQITNVAITAKQT